MNTNFENYKALERAEKNKWLAVNEYLNEDSGIYLLTREEGVFKYAYIGQARHILTRLSQHLNGYTQHIDLSLRKHGLKTEDNPTGWNVVYVRCEVDQLDELEKKYIEQYAKAGFQLLNKTTGSQGTGKKSLTVTAKKGYLQGKQDGYNKCRKELQKLFATSLKAEINGEANRYKKIALQKFYDFLHYSVDEKDEK